jgi:hypothetical protein
MSKGVRIILEGEQTIDKGALLMLSYLLLARLHCRDSGTCMIRGFEHVRIRGYIIRQTRTAVLQCSATHRRRN